MRRAQKIEPPGGQRVARRAAGHEGLRQGQRRVRTRVSGQRLFEVGKHRREVGLVALLRERPLRRDVMLVRRFGLRDPRRRRHDGDTRVGAPLGGQRDEARLVCLVGQGQQRRACRRAALRLEVSAAQAERGKVVFPDSI